MQSGRNDHTFTEDEERHLLGMGLHAFFPKSPSPSLQDSSHLPKINDILPEEEDFLLRFDAR